MDIHEEADQIVAESMPETITTTDYEQERARWYIEQAKEMYQAEGTFEVGSVQSLIMTNPMPGCYSIQFWFVMLIDKQQQVVRGAIFSETRD